MDNFCLIFFTSTLILWKWNANYKASLVKFPLISVKKIVINCIKWLIALIYFCKTFILKSVQFQPSVGILMQISLAGVPCNGLMIWCFLHFSSLLLLFSSLSSLFSFFNISSVLLSLVLFIFLLMFCAFTFQASYQLLFFNFFCTTSKKEDHQDSNRTVSVLFSCEPCRVRKVALSGYIWASAFGLHLKQNLFSVKQHLMYCLCISDWQLNHNQMSSLEQGNRIWHLNPQIFKWRPSCLTQMLCLSLMNFPVPLSFNIFSLVFLFSLVDLGLTHSTSSLFRNTYILNCNSLLRSPC